MQQPPQNTTQQRSSPPLFLIWTVTVQHHSGDVSNCFGELIVVRIRETLSRSPMKPGKETVHRLVEGQSGVEQRSKDSFCKSTYQLFFSMWWTFRVHLFWLWPRYKYQGFSFQNDQFLKSKDIAQHGLALF